MKAMCAALAHSGAEQGARRRDAAPNRTEVQRRWRTGVSEAHIPLGGGGALGGGVDGLGGGFGEGATNVASGQGEGGGASGVGGAPRRAGPVAVRNLR